MHGHASPKMLKKYIKADSLYTARAAMKIYGTQPGKALTIIDSALAVGNVSPFREQFKKKFGMTPAEYRQNL